MTIFEGEAILPDDYPVYGDYFYVVDENLYRSNWHDITVGRLKKLLGASEIRRCNIVARQRAAK